MSKEQHLLVKLKKRYLYLRGVELVLFSIALALISYAAAHFFISSIIIQITIAIVIGITCLAFVGHSLGIFRLSELRIAKYLNQHYPQLESSTDLLMNSSDDLSTLQLIQKSQVYNKLQLLENEIRFPHRIVLACTLFVIGLTAWFVTHYYLPATSSVATTSNLSTDVKSLKETVLPVGLNQAKVFITAPSYTQVASSSVSNLSLKVIEGSTVKWEILFSGEPIEPAIIFSGKDTIRLKQQSNSYVYQKTLTDGGFYQLAWKDQSNKIHQSDYYPIEIIKDEAPKISVQNLAQFVELKITDRLVVDLKANLTDDFGLKDSRIIATVSKGSGESVKFREEILRFTQPTQFNGKNQLASRSIDILKLGLEPGDELYFYIEALDNKIPIANKSRTETFFIALQDTTSYEMAEDQGLGVDLMPEYFRSQRQIIIDSEKILAERKAGKIKKEDFNSKSNELGYDQKVLRLRYGQFMGEEADSGIAHEVSAHPDEEDEEEDPMKKFGHQHDTENEHHLVADKKSEAKDTHDHSTKEGDQENPMAAFMHNHDDTEEATFFAQSVKTKLKAALTLMWDAELYLRMYQPEQSLPYQYKILKLLKEISNDSRVYVHRSGFDPPPLKEEKRLSGDLAELKDSFNKRSAANEISYPSIRLALPVIETLLLQQHPVLNQPSLSVLQKAGNELAGIAIQQPGVYLKSLSSLKAIVNGELKTEDIKSALREVQHSFWKILPQEAVNPSAKKSVSHPMEANFIQQLEALKHER